MPDGIPVDFQHLPIEILPLIIQYILKPVHLGSICLVSTSFHTFAAPRLYERAVIFAWHKNGKQKVIKLFRTLSECPHLARHVKRLEIRDFPKALNTIDAEEIMQLCLAGIGNCVNLESCTWTRDGSVNSEILGALQKCPKLQILEVNGHNHGHYQPYDLLDFKALRKISLIMPSLGVIDVLPQWMESTSATLRTFTMICQASTMINDDLLEGLAPNMAQLEHFHLAGCPKVTERGILGLLSANEYGILSLGLEGLSPKFDMTSFSHTCIRTDALSRLQSITLTVQPLTKLDEWMENVVILLSNSPIEVFQIYSSGANFETTVPDHFWTRIVDTHGFRLRRFSVHRVRMSMSAIDDICRRCTKLEQLFLVVSLEAFGELGPCLARAQNLRALHINFPLRDGYSGPGPALYKEDALALVERHHLSISQFGCNTRVWQVSRAVETDEDGQVYCRTRLLPYDSPDVPEQFMVVKA